MLYMSISWAYARPEYKFVKRISHRARVAGESAESRGYRRIDHDFPPMGPARAFRLSAMHVSRGTFVTA